MTTPSYACAPGIALRHRGTLTSPPPAHFRVVRPDEDGTIHLSEFDGATWTGWELGPPCRVPSTYKFSLDWVHVENTMSSQQDTDVAAATLATGAWPPQSSSYSLGEHLNNGDHQLFRLEFNATVELCEPTMLSWSIVNSGSSLAAKALVKATEDSVSDFIVSSDDSTFLNSFVDTIVSAILDSAFGWAFGGCDGIVSVGALPYPNGFAVLRAVLPSPAQKLLGSTRYTGHNSNSGCRTSQYTVKWSIQLTG